MTAHELVPTREYEHTDYYHDCIEPADLYDSLSITLENSPSLNAGLAVHRSKHEPLFDQADKVRLECLVPHLRRMVGIRRTFENQARLWAMNEAAVRHLAFGLIVLDSEGRITFSNCVAEEIFSSGDGLGTRNGRLAAFGPDREALAEAVARALGGNRIPAPCGSDVCIRRKSGRRPYLIQILPLRADARMPFALIPETQLRGALAAITDPETGKAPHADVLRQMFGLTATESSVALKLGEGRTVGEVAEALGVERSTVRWHLRNIQMKMGHRRQAELTRLLAGISPVFKKN